MTVGMPRHNGCRLLLSAAARLCLAACSSSTNNSTAKPPPAGTVQSAVSTAAPAGTAAVAGSPAASRTASAPTGTARAGSPAAAATKPAQRVTVHFGGLGEAIDGPIFVGKEKGFFDEQGIDVDLQTFQSLSQMIPLLANGKLDAGTAAPTPASSTRSTRG